MKDLTQESLGIILTENQRANLGSVQNHPGFVVFIDTILKGHADQQIHAIYAVPLDDPNRTVKLDAICAVAHAMQKFLHLAKRELKENWDYLRAQEANSRKAAEEAL